MIEELDAVLRPWKRWQHQCHAVSLAVCRSGILGPEARVARGACHGVPGQHSWVAVGDPYGDTTPIIDCSLWSYVPGTPRIWRGDINDGLHKPKGYGSIWEYGRPVPGTDEPLALTGEMSKEAELFLELVGPLDVRGWARLYHGPLQDWPASEILALLLAEHPGLNPLIPIDIVGMLTDSNPEGLYR